MELIESFSVDHTRVVPGIFTSRVDRVGENVITTYDIRLKMPNVEPAIDPAAMHSLEHIIATYLRNDPQWKSEIIYWGPMGCLTGFYLILKGDLDANDPKLFQLVLSAFCYAKDATCVPGDTAINCGNYRMHNLEMAKYYASEFVSYLEIHKHNESMYEYPKSRQILTSDDKIFFDS